MVNIKASPLKGTLKVTSNFGYRTINGGSGNHKGTDFGGTYGEAIYAVDNGTVDLIEYDDDGYGHYIVLKHDGYYTLYGHMNTSPSAYVSTGASVTAGQQIGSMGNSGGVVPKPTSANPHAGTHLHFEIRLGSSSIWNATPVNPMEYLKSDYADANYYTKDPSIDTNINNSNISNPNISDVPTATELGYSVYSNEEGSGIYPETIANIAMQPMSTFVEVYIGDQKLTLLPPNYLQGLEVNKIANNQSMNFTLTIFDDNWEDVEYLFSKNIDNIKFRYGFVNGKTSGVYKAQIIDYTIDFRSTGVILNIKGMTTGARANLHNMTLNTGTINPTEAAKKIARAAGWQVFDENFHPSQDIEFNDRDSITIKNERPATYIINKLAPLAVRLEDGKGGYRFYLDETQDPPVAYFRPIDLSANAKRTYVYMKGVDSPILDLQLSVNGVLGGAAVANYVGTKIVSTAYDPITKEEVSLSQGLNDTYLEVDGGYSHTSSEQYVATVDAGGSSRSEMNARLRYRMSFGGSGEVQYTGYMTIVGDPTIESITTSDDETIRLLIITDRGDLHHSSGLYAITQITDTIQSGIMRTTLKIEKRSDLEDGIELINYRKFLR